MDFGFFCVEKNTEGIVNCMRGLAECMPHKVKRKKLYYFSATYLCNKYGLKQKTQYETG